MKIKSYELPRRLQAGSLPPAILLFGQDQGLIMNSAASIRRAVFDEDHADFDLETFFGADLDMERFLSSCQGYPLLASRRFVILKEADRLAAAPVKTVLNYLKHPSSSTLLLILAGNLEAKNPLRRGIEYSKTAWCIPFYPLEGDQRRRWLSGQLQQAGFRIEPDALQQLNHYLGGDTRNSQQELDKLMLFMGKQTTIRLDDVLAMVGETTTHSAFGLSAAITGGKMNDALHILERVLEQGEEPLMLLAIISQRLRRLAQCGERLAQGDDPRTVAKELQIFWKEQTLFFQQSRAIPTRSLADGLLDCLEADYNLKGGANLPTRQVMERFIMRLTARFGRGESNRGHRPDRH